MNRFVLKNTFIKIYISHISINIFIIKGSKLCFGDRVVVLNDFFYQHGGSTQQLYDFTSNIYRVAKKLSNGENLQRNVIISWITKSRLRG